jgi:disease resistance protein RPS2
MAEGIVFAILGKISEYTVAPIGRQFGYLFCYNNNITELRRAVEKLGAEREGVQANVTYAENNLQDILPAVKSWLDDVDEKMEEAKLVLEGNIGKGCFSEWCLNLKPRHSLSRRATKRTQDLIALSNKNFQTVSCPRPPPAAVSTSVSDNTAIASTSTSKSGVYKSRLSILEDVIEAVKSSDIHTIGICGMGGVGKTTMVEDVKKRASELLFEESVMVAVGKDQDEKKIQSGIAEFLGMKLDVDELLVRASRLQQRLSIKGSDGKRRKILIILDDLWEELDLKKVGIPSRDEHGSCKIILTTRFPKVCLLMKAKTFDVPVMEFEEACHLFENSIQPTTMKPNWKDIVKECGGLPIAITIIAKMLVDKKDDYTWNHVLGQLKRSSLKGEYEKVYDVFRVSYDYIKDKEIKEIFLLCCLYPEDEDILIEDLVRNGWGLRIFENVDYLHEARDAAHAHIEVL